MKKIFGFFFKRKQFTLSLKDFETHQNNIFFCCKAYANPSKYFSPDFQIFNGVQLRINKNSNISLKNSKGHIAILNKEGIGGQVDNKFYRLHTLPSGRELFFKDIFNYNLIDQSSVMSTLNNKDQEYLRKVCDNFYPELKEEFIEMFRNKKRNVDFVDSESDNINFNNNELEVNPQEQKKGGITLN